MHVSLQGNYRVRMQTVLQGSEASHSIISENVSSLTECFSNCWHNINSMNGDELVDSFCVKWNCGLMRFWSSCSERPWLPITEVSVFLMSEKRKKKGLQHTDWFEAFKSGNRPMFQHQCGFTRGKKQRFAATDLLLLKRNCVKVIPFACANDCVCDWSLNLLYNID